MYEILIKGGTIFDGTGKRDGFVADIGITGGIISDIGNLKNSSAKKIINAEGFYLSPGFIDILNHSDTYLTLFTVPQQNSLISQGITTIIGGNCGTSLAPLVSSGAIRSVQKWTDPFQINVDWLKMSEFLNLLKTKKQLALNFGTLTGYSTIRNGILKGEQRKLTDQEIEMAGLLLDQSQKDGAFGISSGLSYPSENIASYEELKHMLSIVAKHNNIFSVHLRNESDKLLDSLEEVINIARETGVKIHIAHLKVIGQNNWDKFKIALDKIEKAKNQGVDITFDIFPYASNGMTLYSLLPDWVKRANKDEIKKILQNEDTRKRVEMDLKDMNLNYKKITIASLSGDKIFLGKTIDDIAKNWTVSEEIAIINLLLASNMRVIVFAHILSEENLQSGIKHPLSIISSDGAGYDLEYKKNKDMPHPRAFGAFARYLRKYPNPEKENIISYKEAIYKITGYPAERFKIKRRGKIQKSYFADITIFDPKKIEEIATFEDPYHYSIGILNVIMNGNIIYDNGKYEKGYYGNVLKNE
ncbi:MAG: amidohydrolase family protein [Patescibacteria group bacterium]